MAAITPAYTQVNPNYTSPDLIINIQQASGAFDLISTGAPLVRLGVNDQYIYARTLDIRTQTTSAQSGNMNQLPSVALDVQMISTPTYLFRVRSIYDHMDLAAAGSWSMALPEALRLGCRQGIFQQLRSALLYGMNPEAGEGLANTPGATAETLMPDTDGNDSVVTYDPGQLAIFILRQINAMMTRCMQLGQPATAIKIVGPQRILGTLELQSVVQLTSYQRPGGGTDTTGSMVTEIGKAMGVEVTWNYDDTLIGKGQGGTDLVVMTLPEVKVPNVNRINTDEFASLTPNTKATSLMMTDLAAPREIPTPIAGGAIDVLTEMRSSSGWALRPEAVTLLSMKYE